MNWKEKLEQCFGGIPYPFPPEGTPIKLNGTINDMEKFIETEVLHMNNCCEKCFTPYIGLHETKCLDKNCPCHKDTELESEKEEWGAWKFVSEMLDSPVDGIYRTSKCYKQIYDFVCEQKAKAKEEERERIKKILDETSARYSKSLELTEMMRVEEYNLEVQSLIK
jgi:hypothetical protein